MDLTPRLIAAGLAGGLGDTWPAAIVSVTIPARLSRQIDVDHKECESGADPLRCVASAWVRPNCISTVAVI